MPHSPGGGPGVSLLTLSPDGPLSGLCVLHPGLRLSVERFGPVPGALRVRAPESDMRDPCGTRGSDMLGWALTGDGSLNMGRWWTGEQMTVARRTAEALENAWMGL